MYQYVPISHYSQPLSSCYGLDQILFSFVFNHSIKSHWSTSTSQKHMSHWFQLNNTIMSFTRCQKVEHNQPHSSNLASSVASSVKEKNRLVFSLFSSFSINVLISTTIGSPLPADCQSLIITLKYVVIANRLGRQIVITLKIHPIHKSQMLMTHGAHDV